MNNKKYENITQYILDYCSKENLVIAQKGHLTPDEYDEKKDKSWTEIYEDAKVMKCEEFAEKYPKIWILHREKIQSIMIENAMKAVEVFNGDLKTKNFWLWGKPGVGKSRWAQLQAPYANIFKKNFNKWWDGYKILETMVVILDDYPATPAGNTLAQHMKVWGDRYPFIGECKGSHMMLEPSRFIFIVTSNYPIEQCFALNEDKEAILRRFTQIEVKEGDLYNQGIVRLDLSILKLD